MKVLFSFFICFSFLHSNSQSPDKQKNNLSYRPSFHFAPAKNWTNDPNGLVYYKGNYHLYFQYNPFADKWGHMSWGHATSKDLIHWNETAVALPEYKNADGTVTMIFSGTAVVDSFNTSGFGKGKNSPPLVAVYTADIDSNGVGLNQRQNIAYSFDGTNFIGYSNNPVLDVSAKDFRDPKVFWYEPEKKWIMIVSKPTEYKVQFYSSIDLKSWKYMSEFGGTGNIDRVWECPDIFEMPVKNSKEKKWVITLSAGHPEKGFLAMQYFIGDFNGDTFKADSLNYPLYLDYGKDFYAGITYNNMPSKDKRRIMIGWANCWEYAHDIPTKGFRGMMAIPRELSLLKSKANAYILCEQPIDELNSNGKVLFQNKNVLVKNESALSAITGDALEIEFEIAKACTGKSGIKVFKNGQEETLIYFDEKENAIKIDRTKSGNINFNRKFSSIESAPLVINHKNVKFKILIDKSIVEVFVDDGEVVMTDLVFPTKANGSVEFFASEKTSQFKNVKILKINSSLNNEQTNK